ncbi:thioesterase [Streptomyces pluripotens]|uniref:Thioesterase n=1 Tax=Streptomyces pluripotens TaxID=1355015 RepID=A0A221P9Q6_9ACTN|nr:MULTISPECIES: alpha/beta fold hydrolase [Streptomyces]ARP74541.1 thioesterase [Streptomyces pluripotens]ASN28816.1 thioesterase [Streptomyces pluripotens]KIE26958.1 oleoyl-ACP hydrolase [Streptomyces sp. MUSC 125]MCH0557326.1 thioesterase [Streptomyces sp. MUM 16J]
MNSVDDDLALWARRYHQAPGSAVRLICFPHAGGSASFYFPMSTAFAPGADVIALQYPGRQDRRLEPCLTDIEELADRITGTLLQLDEKPTLFFGHSMGAVLAFETAWRLERKGSGAAPRALIASGRRAPSTHRPETVHQRDDDGIIAELKLLNGTDAQVLGNEEILRMALPAIRGDYEAIEKYRCDEQRRVHCRITTLTGDADPRTTVEEAAAWERHTDGAFRLEVLPGGHFFLTNQQAAVTSLVSRELGQL